VCVCDVFNSHTSIMSNLSKINLVLVFLSVRHTHNTDFLIFINRTLFMNSI
jgi:hypothetical protein